MANAVSYVGPDVMVEIQTKKKLLAVGEASMAIFWPTPGLKEDHLSALRS